MAATTVSKKDCSSDWDLFFEELVATDSKLDPSAIISPTDDLVDLFEEEKHIEFVDYKMCPQCQIKCKVQDNVLICEQCGLERECREYVDVYNAGLGQNYNTTSNSHVTFKIIGKNSYHNQRSMLKTCSNYSIFRCNSNKKEFNDIVFRYEGDRPPLNVVMTAAEMFDKILMAGNVYRKNGKRGVMAACMYYSCIIHGLTRSPKAIIDLMGTEEKFLSQGDRILQHMNERGIIDIPVHHDPYNDYFTRYFAILGIPEKYKTFARDLIRRAERKHLHVGSESRTTTKCIGVVYLLTQRVPDLKHITKDMITEACGNISKVTVPKYYEILMANGLVLKKCFKKHGVPMPRSWKHS
jgi:transcription initiation factor TFIIIB Brf1 subunit/transcription initiation factor TFIIB